MELIIYDELKIREAQEQIAALRKELDRIHNYIRQVKKETSDSFLPFLSADISSMWEREYEKAEEQLYNLEMKLKSVSRCYEETENKNINLVKQLPVPKYRAFGKVDRIKNQEQQMYHIPKHVKTDGRIFAGSVQHEAWLIQTIESML